MLLVIHAGLHKSASTYLQHVLFLNRVALRQRGVYFEPDALMQANHGTAWMVLQNNLLHAQAHIREAAKAGCSAMILSSEDFEGLIFRRTRARALEEIAYAAGVTEIEWHFCLRDPGDYFLSMYSELSKPTFVDFTAMFAMAARDGKFRIDREPKHLPRYWEFCFDYPRYLGAMADAVSGKLVFHDFRHNAPFPGHGIVTRLAGGLALDLPSANSRNQRLRDEEVEANVTAHLEAIAESAGLPPDTRSVLLSHVPVPHEAMVACAAAISQKFAPGMEALLQGLPAHTAAA